MRRYNYTIKLYSSTISIQEEAMEEKLSKRERTRRTLMHHAKILFEQKGLDSVTFDDIAQAAKVCRTTVFNHFSTISELMGALIDGEIQDLTETCCGSGKNGRELIYLLLDKLSDDLCNYPILMTRLTNNSILRGTGSNAIVTLEELIRENIGFIEPRPCILNTISEEELPSLIMSVYYGQVNHIHARGGAFDKNALKDCIHRMLDYILRGE